MIKKKEDKKRSRKQMSSLKSYKTEVCFFTILYILSLHYTASV